MIMTTKEFEEWVAKTWKECQERAWAPDSCEKTTPTKELDNCLESPYNPIHDD